MKDINREITVGESSQSNASTIPPQSFRDDEPFLFRRVQIY